MDMDSITDKLWLGAGVTTEVEVEELINKGITHVIDMRAEFDDHTIFKNRGVNVLWLPQNDDGTPRPPEQVVKGIAFAFAALGFRNESEMILRDKVYVHCAAGVNRGPTEMYAILRAYGLTQDEAIGLLKRKRPKVGFYNIQAYVDSVNSVIA